MHNWLLAAQGVMRLLEQAMAAVESAKRADQLEGPAKDAAFAASLKETHLTGTAAQKAAELVALLCLKKKKHAHIISMQLCCRLGLSNWAAGPSRARGVRQQAQQLAQLYAERALWQQWSTTFDSYQKDAEQRLGTLVQL